MTDIIRFEFDGREHTALFQPNATAPYEIILWVYSDKRGRTVRSYWHTRQGDATGKRARVYAEARRLRREQ